VKTRRAVHAVAIDERQRGISQRGRALDERFRQRRRVEEAESGGCVQFDEHGLRIG
jgi:hypothetical protein